MRGLKVRANTALNQAKGLFKEPPPAEEFGVQLKLYMMKGWEKELRFARDLPFHITHGMSHPGQYELADKKRREFRFDYSNQKLMIAVEIEGGIWTKGRHTRGKGYLNDCHKYNLAQAIGWTVFRFPSELVVSGHAINFIREFIAN